MNKKLIKQLRNGEIAVENDGTLEQLKKVLRVAFPKDKHDTLGAVKYYEKINDTYIGCNTKNLPTVSVKEFFKEETMNLPPIGTKVFHHVYGEGEIDNYFGETNNHIEVIHTEGIKYYRNGAKELSLTPYTVEGFTPLSDYDKPRVGDWGYFWDNEISFVSYSKVGSLEPLKDVTGVIWCNFSKELPEHIKKLQNDKP